MKSLMVILLLIVGVVAANEIVINDKPFYGQVSVSSDPYKLVLDSLIDISR